MRTWALSAGLSLAAGCASIQADPYLVPLDSLSETQKNRVAHVLEDVAAVVALPAAQVRSRLEIYDFLLDQMPFTAAVVRALGRGNWDVERDPKDAAAFTVLDPDGLRMKFELIRRERERRFYLTQGVYPMGLLPPLEGSTVIVMRMVPDGAVIRTDAVVYVRVETALYAQLAKGVRTLLEEKVRERSGFFVEAARWVAEEAAERPGWLVSQVQGSDAVDPGILQEFRRRFLR